MIRREALFIDENQGRDEKISMFNTRQDKLEPKLKKLDQFEEVMKKVQVNNDRLNLHGMALNMKAQNIKTVLENLEGLKL